MAKLVYKWQGLTEIDQSVDFDNFPIRQKDTSKRFVVNVSFLWHYRVL